MEPRIEYAVGYRASPEGPVQVFVGDHMPNLEEAERVAEVRNHHPYWKAHGTWVAATRQITDWASVTRQ